MLLKWNFLKQSLENQKDTDSYNWLSTCYDYWKEAMFDILVQKYKYDLIDVIETWWDDYYDCNVSQHGFAKNKSCQMILISFLIG